MKKMTKTKSKILIILLIAIVAISTVSAVSAASKEIGPNTPGGLKKAIETAKNGDTIHLTNGVYKGKNNREITINKDIKIIGRGSKVIFDGEGKHQLLKIKNNRKVTLQKITFTNGYSKKKGGAIESGTINTRKGTLTIHSCTFTNNIAEKEGGAIDASVATLTVNSCNFKNNTAATPTSKRSSGGAINSWVNEGTVSKSTFTSNTADINGGALRASGRGKFTVSKSTFTNNKATKSYAGAIFNGASMKITDSTFKNNPAKYNWSIFSSRGCSLTTKNIKLTGGSIERN